MERIVSTDSEFAAALLAINPGDCLYLRGGIYKQPVSVLRGGVPNQPVRIMPWGEERAVFTMPPAGQFFVNAPCVSVDGLWFRGGGCVRSEGAATDCEFRNLRISDTTQQGLTIRGPRTRIEHCQLSARDDGTNQVHALYIAASGCTVRGNTIFGDLHVYNSGTLPADCLFEDNTVECLGGVKSANAVCGKRHVFRRHTARAYGCFALGFLGADEITIEDCDIQGFPNLIYDQYSTPAEPLNVTMRRCKLRGMKQTAAGWKLTEEDNTWEK